MYHPYQKNSSYLRDAIFHTYKQKCVYCGNMMQQRNMHIDHILPSNMQQYQSAEILKYLEELDNQGFVIDSIENYLPTCPACNIQKSNNVFQVTNLRYYHELAKRNSACILERIERLKNSVSEYFYEPTDESQWEELDFKHQRSIASAIMGYRLTPADVQACPRFPQVDKLKKQIEIVDYVTLQGEPGCGKSISLYQAAYDYHLKGWHVYRYIGRNNECVPVIPHNTERSLYLFDDAQNLSEEVIQKVQDQARSNRKIILAKTTTSAISFDTILLTNQEAVRILKEYCFNRIGTITPIINQCDHYVGVGFMDIPVERRINEAGKAATPWAFNYVLRGGWQAMKSLYSIIRSHKNCGLLAVVIAIFQVAQKDQNIDFDWLCQWILNFDCSLKWNREDLDFLIDKKIVISCDDVRIVHIQSAYVIIAQYLDESTKDDLLRLREIIETAYCEKRISPLGIVWLCNGIRSHTRIWRIEKWFISDKMVHTTLRDLEGIETPSERLGVAYFFEKVLLNRDSPLGIRYFHQNENIIQEWIAQADSSTAYAYSVLINALHNVNEKDHRAFAQRIDWSKIIAAMEKDTDCSYYCWGRLINRLAVSLPVEKHKLIEKELMPYTEKVSSIISISDIIEFSEYLCSISYYVSNTCAIVRKMIPTYHSLFTKDMHHAFDLFDLDFLSFFCGISFWGNRKISEEVRLTASALVDAIPEEELAAAISNSYPRDWQRIHEIMYLIVKYDKQKAKSIVRLIDLNKISSWREVWKNSYEVKFICWVLEAGDPILARRYIEMNKDHIIKVYAPVALCAPRYSVDLFDEGIHIELITEHHWDICYSLFKKLIKIDRDKAIAIMNNDIPNIVNKINSTTALNFTEAHFLHFIKDLSTYFPDIFRIIANQIDLHHIEKNWEKASYNPRQKKTVYKRYEIFHQLIANVQNSNILENS